MTRFKVYYTTVIEQAVEVDIDTEAVIDPFEEALDRAYDSIESVPFIGWNFDASGDWEPVHATNLDTGEGREFGW